MIGLVEVDVEKIIQAYKYLKEDKDCIIKQNKSFMDKLIYLSNVLDYSKKNKRKLFSNKEKIHIKQLLEELVYASLMRTKKTSSMYLRIEVASIIQDILEAYSNQQKNMMLENKSEK